MTEYSGKASPNSGSGGGSGGSINWGDINGTLSNQTDLQTALNAKQDELTVGTGIDITGDTISVDGEVVSEVTLATVATTGSYNDLSNRPNIPTVNDATLTITQGGISKGTFTANASTDVTISLDSGVTYDSSTINENPSNQLQAIGVINPQSDTAIRIWNGTEQQWEQGESVIWYNWEYTSSGGSWTSETSGVSVILQKITYGNNKFIAVGSSGTILSSSDGSTWTQETSEISGTTTALRDITYGNNKFIIVGNNGIILNSSDGSTWTAQIPDPVNLNGVTYGNNKFIAVGQSGTILSSSDGSTWTAETSGVSVQLNNVTYGNNKFIAVGNSGTILSSSDGSTWTSELSGDPAYLYVYLYDVTYGNNKFIAVANGGIILSSSDGSTWTQETSGVSSVLFRNVTYGNNKFVVVGENGIILSSSDGNTWTAETSGVSDYLYGVTYANNKFIAVGENGTILSNLGQTLSCFTTDSAPTTASTVYSAPNTTSALTITSVSTGTITLSDTNTYSYNASGNETTYTTIGESHPEWICNINEVGVKVGDTTIATAGTGASGSFTTSDSKTVTVVNGIITEIV